jgi:hypothetical protein
LRASTQIGAGGRSADLDIFKTMLVWGMITAHCIQLLAFHPKPPAETISVFINLITFSGFMFAFGYGVGLSKRVKGWGERLWPVLLLLVATWVSELAFEVLVDKKPLTPDLLISLLTLSRLYGWSEFLASFTLLYLIIAVARPVLVAIGNNWLLLVVAILTCFASTFVVVSQDVPAMATLVGTRNFASFPVLAYLPWFLVGIAFARRPQLPRWIEWALAAIGSGVFVYFLWRNGGQLPERFPPSIAWVVGAAVPLLVYLMLARGLARLRVPPILLQPGRHVLAALVVSNLTIFGLRWWQGYRLGAWWWTPIFAVALIALVTIWCALLDAWRMQRRAAA